VEDFVFFAQGRLCAAAGVVMSIHSENEDNSEVLSYKTYGRITPRKYRGEENTICEEGVVMFVIYTNE
jgi:hypothetical protein